jgi:two-component system, chemotaxis family, protein-glutamate methylesterase/glutaminase
MNEPTRFVRKKHVLCGIRQNMKKNENFAIVVIGGSAGAVETVMSLGRALPADLNAAVFIALHLSPSAPSALAELIGRKAAMRVAPAQDGEDIEPGRIYVARPDLHLVVEAGRVALGRGPRENGHRPSVDPLFRTAARVYKQRVIGVVLSGNLDDGSAGLREIRSCGGRAIVQDPADAAFPGMPSNALDIAGADATVSAAQLAERITEFVNAPNGSNGKPDDVSHDIATGGRSPMTFDEREAGKPSPFGCPDCGGALWEVQDGQLVRYRCRVGHAYNEEALLEAQTEGIERAMWAALRALEEAAGQARRMTERMRQRGHQ